MLRWLILYNPFAAADKRSFVRFIVRTTGFVPHSLAVYRLAFTHISMLRQGQSSAMHCNERLEFLGDAILSSVIAEYLYKKYPLKDEGYLTELRSRVVNRGTLNNVAMKLGMNQWLKYDRSGNWMNRSIFGNTLEAFIGALYLDLGYRATRHFVIERILALCIDMDELAATDQNYKSRLMEYAQKNKLQPVRYELVAEKAQGNQREFTIAVKIGDDIMGTGTDTKKKYAEQKASEVALQKLLAQPAPQ